MAATRHEVPKQLRTMYEQCGELDEAGWPPSLNELLRDSRVLTIPVYRLDPTAEPSASVLSVTREIPGEYVIAIVFRGEMLGADALRDSGRESGPGTGWDELRFYHGGGEEMDFPSAEGLLNLHFGPRPYRVRYVKAGPDWWVVGRSGTKERGALVRQIADCPDCEGGGSEQRAGFGDSALVIKDCASQERAYRQP